MTTRKEELKVLADMIFEDDPRYVQVLEEEKAAMPKTSVGDTKRSTLDISVVSKKEDPLRNKPMFHLVDKFSLLGFEHLDIQYIFTLILNESLYYFKKFEQEKLMSM